MEKIIKYVDKFNMVVAPLALIISMFYITQGDFAKAAWFIGISVINTVTYQGSSIVGSLNSISRKG